ncbi:GNAT family N-acetyltransferase [Phototrophicus methaneseepsis]|uniref:GNAT family N-acetyltransferase n=1 Tax=Phototrophicus methaneseepsis TaxID=2710758 RepID=A0A7S8E9H3_9CHLR|nr:GNAT family N-acetyltransferase [Phototrophicus methaneseepsis]QPC82854.1 GNAT family N-acetyltransferase [Phototrophicus methaneseepsis]
MAKKQQLTLKLAERGDWQALYGILAIAGEHMHRTLGLAHWYPFRTYDRFLEMTDTGRLYAVYSDDLLVATFNLSTMPRSYYRMEMWTDEAHKAFYLGGVGVLPSQQGQGVGKWLMGEVDRLCHEEEVEAVRFDAVANHSRLLAFYDRLGYERRAFIPIDELRQLVAFERVFV